MFKPVNVLGMSSGSSVSPHNAGAIRNDVKNVIYDRTRWFWISEDDCSVNFVYGTILTYMGIYQKYILK